MRADTLVAWMKAELGIRGTCVAAQRALELAEATNTPCLVMRDGKLVISLANRICDVTRDAGFDGLSTTSEPTLFRVIEAIPD